MFLINVPQKNGRESLPVNDDVDDRGAVAFDGDLERMIKFLTGGKLHTQGCRQRPPERADLRRRSSKSEKFI